MSGEPVADWIGPVADACERAAATMNSGPNGRKFGGKTAYTLLSAIRAGNYASTAARLVGITDRTLRGWQERGREDLRAGRDTGYSVLTAAITRAEAEAEARLVARLDDAARADSKHWGAAAHILERRFRDRWARNEAPQVQLQVGVGLGIASGRDDRAGVLAAVRANLALPDPESPTNALQADDED